MFEVCEWIPLVWVVFILTSFRSLESCRAQSRSSPLCSMVSFLSFDCTIHAFFYFILFIFLPLLLLNVTVGSPILAWQWQSLIRRLDYMCAMRNRTQTFWISNADQLRVSRHMTVNSFCWGNTQWHALIMTRQERSPKLCLPSTATPRGSVIKYTRELSTWRISFSHNFPLSQKQKQVKPGSCRANPDQVRQAVEKICVGQKECRITAYFSALGVQDPCPGVQSRLCYFLSRVGCFSTEGFLLLVLDRAIECGCALRSSCQPHLLELRANPSSTRRLHECHTRPWSYSDPQLLNTTDLDVWHRRLVISGRPERSYLELSTW